MTTIALIGAGGKMGGRIIDHLLDHPDYQLRCVETGERGIATLAEAGIAVLPADTAVIDADVMILALPDRVLGSIAHSLVPWSGVVA